jgi:enamine deaminase RidA (YjgF/YER057c/UK114 family)
VAVSPDRTQDIKAQTLGTLGVLDTYLKEAGLDRTRIVKAEVVVTDHDNKPAFDEAWASWMPAGYGPVRSFVESRMPEGDLIEIIITAALPT